jgi:hypothetical protein
MTRAVLVALAIIIAAPAFAADLEPAKVVPNDTFLLLYAPNVQALTRKFESTSIYGLYKEPAMQPVIQPADSKIREKIQEGIAEMWREAGLEGKPQELPLPTGALGLAMRMRIRSMHFPNYDFSEPMGEGGPKVTGMHEVKVPDPEVVFMADFGDKIKTIEAIIAQLQEKAADKSYRREHETIRGIEVHIVTEPVAPPPAGMPPGMPQNEPDSVAWFVKGSVVVVGPSPELVKAVAARMGGGDAATLADEANFKALGKSVDMASADVGFFLNAAPLLDLADKLSSSAEDKAQSQKVIKALGVDSLTGLAAAVTLAPKNNEDMRLKATIGIKGPRTGLVALLLPASKSTKPPGLLNKGLAGFVTANYEPSGIFDKIAQIARDIAGENIEDGMKEAMSSVMGENPVDVRKDILGEMSGPITVSIRMDKPYTDPKSSSMLLGIGARDAAALDKAIGRIHQAIVARGGGKEMQREINGVNVYLMPGPGLNMMNLMMMAPFRHSGGAAPMMRPDRGDEMENAMAIAVAGDTLVFGGVDGVQQVVREHKAASRASIDQDPMYQYAAKALPAQAGIVMYGNDQIQSEALWEMLKKGAATTTEPDDEVVMGPAMIFSGMTREFKREFGVDFAKLPEFEKVRQYFGASIGWVVATDEGLSLEMVGLKAPAGPTTAPAK